MAKSAALSDELERMFHARKITEGTVIEALGMLFAVRSPDAARAGQYATALSVAIGAMFKLKQPEKSNG